MSTAHPLGHDSPEDWDQRVFLRMGWPQFRAFLALRGDTAIPRITYTSGVLELMSPSKGHESRKSIYGTLIGIWAEEREVELTQLGSWTLEAAEQEKALEPDDCFAVGDADAATRPDLAIEVFWTSGSLKKLEIYAAVGVPEVWIWRRGQLAVWVLDGGGYRASDSSRIFPGLDVEALSSFAERTGSHSAIARAWRASLRGSTT